MALFGFKSQVSVTYRRGLPVITVPLPSRREKCRFTLRPVSQTVGDLLDQLYEALNVREHQIKKERELRAQLEKLSTELQPLEEVDKLQKDLARLRDPLNIHLPENYKIPKDDTKRSPLTKIKDMLEETSKKMKIT
ncbi:unnamed protein product [Leptidea sinapis]|uniref:Uncharacterized protein n=1 Tax=Leptidea sinapis TaxID=189913 RepID=A0A5E4R262_9NEOP|nr:unnamed protein product [Leptidea sinapis]